MPLWHNIICCPPGIMTDFPPKLVRAGITLLSDVSDKEQFIQQLPMVTKSSYRAGFKRLDQSPRNPLAAYHMPAFWTLWGRKRVAQHLATSEQIKPRQPPEVWTAFLKITRPPGFREFIRLALWRKLPVGSRLNSWLNDGGLCPFHQQLETVPHVLTECLFLGVAESFVHLVFPKVTVCVLSRTEESLSHPAGLLVWTAIHAHWQLRSIVKLDPPTSPVTLNRFLHLWCSSISDWANPPGCSLIRGFQRSIDSFIKQ